MTIECQPSLESVEQPCPTLKTWEWPGDEAICTPTNHPVFCLISSKNGTHPSQKSLNPSFFVRTWPIHFGEASQQHFQAKMPQIKHILYKFQAQDCPQVGRYVSVESIVEHHGRVSLQPVREPDELLLSLWSTFSSHSSSS